MNSDSLKFRITKIHQLSNNDSEMANFDQEVSHLVLMKSSNYATLDDYIYLPNTQFNITPSHPDTVTLDLHIPKENNVLICFQIKKDFQVVLDNFDDINEIWKDATKRTQKWSQSFQRKKRMFCLHLLILRMSNISMRRLNFKRIKMKKTLFWNFLF